MVRVLRSGAGRRRRRRRRVLLILATPVGVALVAGLVLVVLVRLRPAYYHDPDDVPPAVRAERFAAFERKLDSAKSRLRREDRFEVTLTGEEVNAALARYGESPEWRRRLGLPPGVKHLQVALEPGRSIAMGLVRTRLGAVVVSAHLRVENETGDAPRVRVERLMVGNLRVPISRARKLVAAVEDAGMHFDLGGTGRVRVTGILLAEDEVTIRGVRERR